MDIQVNTGRAAKKHEVRRPPHIFVCALVCASLALSSCASRPGNDVLTTVAQSEPDARIVNVQTVSTRERETPRSNEFTNARSDERNFARFSISIPPNHEPGNIEWPRERSDPRTSFAVVGQGIETREGFLGNLAGSARRPTDVFVFVHGYNQSFPEALYRLAQLSADSQTQDVPVLFAWPSQGALTGYVADRESAAFSRDALAATLNDLAADRRVGSITLFAHSLGSWLTMEALRQMRLSGDDATLDRLTVILAAPDIDVDVFRRQVAVVGPLTPPLVVLVSPDDQALRLSRSLGGSHQRVGALDVRDPKVLEIARQSNIAIVDISGVASGDSLNHSRYAALAGLAASIDGEQSTARGVRSAGAFVFNTVGATLSSPFNLVGQALAGE